MQRAAQSLFAPPSRRCQRERTVLATLQAGGKAPAARSAWRCHPEASLRL